jgi:hypothetical protein
MLVFNAMIIMAMVDRWRSETHSFHLPCREMTVTLEDVTMILGLPIRGYPVTVMWTQQDGVRESPSSSVGSC